MSSNRDELQKSVGLQRRAQTRLRGEDPGEKRRGEERRGEDPGEDPGEERRGEERRGDIEVLMPSLRTDKKSMKSNIDIATIWRFD